jgi:hypothetical protein
MTIAFVPLLAPSGLKSSLGARKGPGGELGKPYFRVYPPKLSRARIGVLVAGKARRGLWIQASST